MKILILTILLAPQIGFGFELVALPGGFIEVTHSNFSDPPKAVDKFDSEKGKKIRKRISEALAPLDNAQFAKIQELFGPPQPISQNYKLPKLAYAMLTISSHQNMGKHHFFFYPIKDFGGLLVIKYDKKETISGSAIYVKDGKLDQTDAVISEIGAHVREIIETQNKSQ